VSNDLVSLGEHVLQELLVLPFFEPSIIGDRSYY